MRLPTIKNYPGLQLAGYGDLGPIGHEHESYVMAGSHHGLAGGLTDNLKSQVVSIINDQFNRNIAPKIQEEAAKGAEAAVKPYIFGALALSATALVVAFLALGKK